MVNEAVPDMYRGVPVYLTETGYRVAFTKFDTLSDAYDAIDEARDGA